MVSVDQWGVKHILSKFIGRRVYALVGVYGHCILLYIDYANLTGIIWRIFRDEVAVYGICAGFGPMRGDEIRAGKNLPLAIMSLGTRLA